MRTYGIYRGAKRGDEREENSDRDPRGISLYRQTDIQNREGAAECDDRRDRYGADEDAVRVRDRVAATIGEVVPGAELREEEQGEGRVDAQTHT